MKRLAVVLCAVALATSFATAAQPVRERCADSEDEDGNGRSAWVGAVAIGIGIIKDGVQAVKWVRSTANQGYATAQAMLGAFYACGTGLATEAVEAVAWARRTAERGYARVQRHLKFPCSRGEPRANDDIELASGRRTAAKPSDARAQFALGVSHRDGIGVAKDEVEAYALFNLAAVTEEDAREAREALEKTLSRKEISAGQRRTRQLQEESEAGLPPRR